jgi:sulfur-oxidizing protein SoxY
MKPPVKGAAAQRRSMDPGRRALARIIFDSGFAITSTLEEAMETRVNRDRRRLLHGGAGVVALAVAAGLFRSASAWAQGAWNKAAFDTKSLADAVKAMGGASPVESKDIAITSPDIAENGAVVPFTIASNLPKTEAIAILVEKNPNILAANFTIPDGTEPWVNTRVKMGQTSNVFALVKADGKFYYAAKEIKVTLGGCGG